MIRKWGGFLYDVVLLRIELAFITLLLANTVGLSLLLIFARNLHFSVWNPSAMNRVIFASAFLACLWGGCLATRRGKHIAIDAAVSHLPGAIRRRLDGLTCSVSAVASLILYYHSIRYLNLLVDPTSSMAPSSDAWFLREWVWKLGVAGAFAQIALHFTVRAVRAFMPSVELEDPDAETLL
ncbi:MAG: TRAP transporter small permease subunit [Deltaproteobacteria bacterium]|nr:TRAP transporter small permease subunit [Deltaproteobacteria bacterium]MBW2362662.1 TRAP transporter small permease subunit [Deltaproteobacteria bacterium]